MPSPGKSPAGRNKSMRKMLNTIQTTDRSDMNDTSRLGASRASFYPDPNVSDKHLLGVKTFIAPGNLGSQPT